MMPLPSLFQPRKPAVRLTDPDGALIGDYRDYDHAVEVLGRAFISRGEYQIAPVPDGNEAKP